MINHSEAAIDSGSAPAHEVPVYEVLAAAFDQESVTTCFALLGDANMNWATAMAKHGCQMIYVRHEHCAVAAAMSWARTSGQPGIATVTCGPGVTQIMTALPAAVRAQIPLVIFAGEAPLRAAWYNQSIDQAPLVAACGAVYRQLHHVESMPRDIRDAFLLARTKQCPVVLGVPMDLQNLLWQGPEVLPSPSLQLMPSRARVCPDEQSLTIAVELLNKADKVVVMAGLGAIESEAGPACAALAERIGGLLATTLPARGLFCDDPFYLGVAGGFSSEVARDCLAEADLVVAVGCSLASHNSDAGKLFPASRVLHVDLAPVAISQGRQAASYHLQTDARQGVKSLLAQVDAREPTKQWRSAALQSRIQNEPADSAEFEIEPGLHDPRTVVSSLDAALPMDWQLVNSSGHCSYFFAQMPGRPAERFHTIREFGAIGNGIAFAMGVATAHPETPVVLFDGDGSLLMHVQELETIRRHSMNILICVMNDGAYGSEIHKLRAEGLSDEGAVFGRPDFAKMAQGFGLGGRLVTDLSDLPAMVNEFLAKGNASVWDFHVSDRVVSPVVRRSHGLQR